MIDLNRRLAKLEDAAVGAKHHKMRLFAIEGPSDLPDDAAATFLRDQGREVQDEDFILVFIDADRDSTLKDVTAKYQS